MKFDFSIAICVIVLTVMTSSVFGVEELIPADRNALAEEGISKIIYLDQNWDPEESTEFYFKTQGSHVIPYEWFLALEQSDNQSLFRDNKNMQKFRYLTQNKDGANPDALPVGFVKDIAQDKKTGKVTNWFGFTCAACHTNQINYNGVGYRVDGAPTLGDVQGLLTSLTDALKKTRDDPVKFTRFVAALDKIPYKNDHLADDLKLVIARREGYDQRNFRSGQGRECGNGRVDAFGAILNEVYHGILKDPQSPTENTEPASAPVSYPCLWDTPQHDKVQWLGNASNGGPFDIGSLGRNVGEVLGVFGDFEIGSPITGNPSSVKVKNLVLLEKSLAELWSPQWPSQEQGFPKIDTALAQKGAALFRSLNCIKCHFDIDRTDPKRKVIAQLEWDVGTDRSTSENFFTRTGATGKLEHRFIKFLPLVDGDFRRFGPTANGNEVLENVVIGTVVGSAIKVAKDELSRFSMRLDHTTTNMIEIPIVGIPSAQPALYKARPLNGIWATAPYLHNGSVPDLENLFRKASNRVKTFYVGSRKFNPETVGFDYTDTEGFKYDTSVSGNKNIGHEGPEFGTDLDDPNDPEKVNAKKALIEYLKTL